MFILDYAGKKDAPKDQCVLCKNILQLVSVAPKL